MSERKVSFYENVKDTIGKQDLCSNILEGIKSGTWKASVERLRSIQAETEQKLYKNTLPCFTASGIFSTRKSDCLVKHSGFLVIDIDAKDLWETKETRKELIKDHYTYCVFASCRGNGLAVVVRIDGTKHLESFKFLETYYRETYGLTIDKSCKDVARLRFVSYDPDLYLNEGATEVAPDCTEEPTYAGTKTQIIKAIIRDGGLVGDDSYESWLKIGFAIANTFGEAGRQHFHALSKASPLYNADECDKKYTSCIESNRGLVGFGTIIHLAKKSGISSGLSALQPKECKYKIKILTVTDMLRYESPEYLINPFIYKNTVNLLQSLPGTGKSVFVLSIADALTGNEPLWGHFDQVTKGKVLIVDEENPGSIHRDRIEKMGIHRDAAIHFIHYQGVKVDVPGWLESLIKHITDEKYVLVIFDALIRLHNAKENDSDEMSKVMRAFREIVRRGITTVLIIHHERKSRDGEKRERSRGSGDIVGAIDTQLILEEGNTTDDGKELTLHPGKTRLKSFSPVRLILNPDTLHISYRGCVGSSSKESIQELVDFVGDNIYCYEEIQDALQIPGKQLRAIIKKALGNELILDSTLKQSPEYKGSPKKQFYKVRQNPLLSHVATFPPMGGETCHIEESRPSERELPGNVETLDFVECGDVSKHGLPRETWTKKHVSEGAKKEGAGNMEIAQENEERKASPDDIEAEIQEVEFVEVIRNV